MIRVVKDIKKLHEMEVDQEKNYNLIEAEAIDFNHQNENLNKVVSNTNNPAENTTLKQSTNIPDAPNNSCLNKISLIHQQKNINSNITNQHQKTFIQLTEKMKSTNKSINKINVNIKNTTAPTNQTKGNNDKYSKSKYTGSQNAYGNNNFNNFNGKVKLNLNANNNNQVIYNNNSNIYNNNNNYNNKEGNSLDIQNKNAFINIPNQKKDILNISLNKELFSNSLKTEFPEEIQTLLYLKKQLFVSDKYIKILNNNLTNLLKSSSLQDYQKGLNFLANNQPGNSTINNNPIVFLAPKNLKSLIKQTIINEIESLKNLVSLMTKIRKDNIVREKSLLLINQLEELLKSSTILDSTGNNSNNNLNNHNLTGEALLQVITDPDEKTKENILQARNNFKYFSLTIIKNFISFRESSAFDVMNGKFVFEKFRDLLDSSLLQKVFCDINRVEASIINYAVGSPFISGIEFLVENTNVIINNNNNDTNNNQSQNYDLSNKAELNSNNLFNNKQNNSEQDEDHSEVKGSVKGSVKESVLSKSNVDEEFLKYYSYLIKEMVFLEYYSLKANNNNNLGSNYSSERTDFNNQSKSGSKQVSNFTNSKRQLSSNTFAVEGQQNNNCQNLPNLNSKLTNDKLNQQCTTNTTNTNKLQETKKLMKNSKSKLNFPKIPNNEAHLENSNNKHHHDNSEVTSTYCNDASNNNIVLTPNNGLNLKPKKTNLSNLSIPKINNRNNNKNNNTNNKRDDPKLEVPSSTQKVLNKHQSKPSINISKPPINNNIINNNNNNNIQPEYKTLKVSSHGFENNSPSKAAVISKQEQNIVYKTNINNNIIIENTYSNNSGKDKHSQVCKLNEQHYLNLVNEEREALKLKVLKKIKQNIMESNQAINQPNENSRAENHNDIHDIENYLNKQSQNNNDNNINSILLNEKVSNIVPNTEDKHFRIEAIERREATKENDNKTILDELLEKDIQNLLNNDDDIIEKQTIMPIIDPLSIRSGKKYDNVDTNNIIIANLKDATITSANNNNTEEPHLKVESKQENNDKRVGVHVHQENLSLNEEINNREALFEKQIEKANSNNKIKIGSSISINKNNHNNKAESTQEPNRNDKLEHTENVDVANKIESSKKEYLIPNSSTTNDEYSFSYYVGNLLDFSENYKKLLSMESLKDQIDCFTLKDNILDLIENLNNVKLVLFEKKKLNQQKRDQGEVNINSKLLTKDIPEFGELTGFCLLGFNEDIPNNQYNLIIKVLLILDTAGYSKILKSLIAFFTESIVFNEIFIELNYVRIGEKQQVNKSIKQHFDSLKFTWRNVVNDGDFRRIRLGKAINSNGSNNNNNNTNFELIKNFIDLQSLLILNIHDKEEIEDENILENDFCYSIKDCLKDNANYLDDFLIESSVNKELNYYLFNHLLSELMSQEKLAINEEAMAMATINVEKKRKPARRISSYCKIDADQVIGFLKNSQLIRKSEEFQDIIKKTILVSNPYSLKFCNYSKFSSKLTVIKENCFGQSYYQNSEEKLIIEKDGMKKMLFNRYLIDTVDLLESNNNYEDTKFYLLKNTLENSAILFFTLDNEKLRERILITEENLYDVLGEIQKDLSLKNTYQSQAIYIPAFRKSSFCISSPNAYPDIKNIILSSKNNDEFIATQLMFEINANCEPDREYNLSVNIPFNKEKDFMIESDFVMCYINLEILSEMNVQSTFASIIMKENFIYI